MRSKASLDGHPVHPALIPFPFAFLTGGFVFDVAGRLLGRPGWWATGYHLALAGLAMSVLAAVPGFVDYAHTVPPRSRASSRAMRHMVLVLAAVGAFVVAVLVRGGAAAGPSLVVLGIEAIGAALLIAGGSAGGDLVMRDQIGVDTGYAGGRRWSETTATSDDEGMVVGARAGELAVDQMKLLRVDGRRLVLARTATGYVAFDDACGHDGGSLAAGTLICGTVQCPWHGSQFDVRTGCVRAGPARRGIGIYHVEETEGLVRVRV